MKLSKKFFKNFLLYVVIGFFSAVLDTAIFTMLVNAVHMDIFFANLISVPFGLTLSFVCNSFVNFRMTDRMIKRAITFYSVGLCGIILSTLILKCGEYINYQIEYVKIIAVLSAGLLQFLLNMAITFKKR